MVENLSIRLFHLLERMAGIKWRDGHVSTVDLYVLVLHDP